MIDNTVIKVLNPEHGKKVIKWFKSKGVDTRGYDGLLSIHYGIVNGYFDNYSHTHFDEIKEKYELKIIELPEEQPIPSTHPLVDDNGIKESNGKLNYEIDWNFITQMAERMDTNKHKYDPNNWQKPMDVDSLKQAMFRHVLEIMKGNFEDEGREFGHLEAISNNAMIINYQLKNKNL